MFWSLDVMRLSSPQGSVLWGVIFNTLFIVVLIPLIRRGGWSCAQP
jgi:high-affinity K+ transport system ATPase subunit B